MRRPLSLVRLALPLLFVAVACDENFEDPITLPNRSMMARFTVGTQATPAFLDVPFPSDVYMANGRFASIPELSRIFKRGTDLLDRQLQKQNGWSRIASAMFLIDDPQSTPDGETGERQTVLADLESLPADEEACKSDASSIFLVDLDTNARVACRGIAHDESDSGGRSLLGIGPARGIVLAEGHKYAAVVTSRVRARGQKVTASEDFKAAARGEGPVGGVYGPAYTKVIAAIGGALASDNAEVVAIAPYTTQKIADELFTLREALEAAPAPALRWDAASLMPMGVAKFTSVTPLPAGFTASLDAWLGVRAPTDPKVPDGAQMMEDTDLNVPVRAHDRIKVVGTAVFDGINYLGVKPDKYDNVDHGTFARDGSGKAIAAPDRPTVKIWATFAVPTVAMPAGGYPVVIIQHGLGGSRASLLDYANRFCAQGWMAVAIDSITFGARASDPKYLVDAETDYADPAKGATYTGPDGISDAVGTGMSKSRAGSTDLFGGLKNIRALGDQIRHAGFDTAQLVKVLRSAPNLTPLETGTGVLTINADKIVYIGDSLGGIEGTIAAAIEPRVKAWVLNVAGGGLLTELGAHGPTIHANLVLAGGANFGLSSKQYTEGHPLVVMGQTLGESGDPIVYASRLVTTPTPIAGLSNKRNLLQVEVLYDEIVSNESNEALARAGGWGLAAPNVGPNAGMSDLAGGKSYRGGGIVLNSVQAQTGGLFRGTPTADVTAVMVQVSPGHHGADITRSSANRTWAIPYNDAKGRLRLEMGQPRQVPCSHNPLLDSVVRFFREAMDGQVPTITGIPAPARDIDADGTPDAADKSPIDKAAQ